jgi:hypothetical protein
MHLTNGLIANVEDIVAQHHQRNHPPHLPDNTHLLTIQNQQTSRSRSASRSAAGDTKEAGTPVPSHPRGAADSPLPPTNANSFPDLFLNPQLGLPSLVFIWTIRIHHS